MPYKEYTVIEALSIQELVNVINAHLNDGWTTVGGVSLTIHSPYPDQLSYHYLQALESVVYITETPLQRKNDE